MSLLPDRAVTRLQPSPVVHILRVVNLTSFIFTATINGLATFFSWAALPVYVNNPTFVAPSATLVTVFWVALHLCQAGFAFYTQFGNELIIQEIVYGAVGWQFFVTNILLFLWIGAWVIESFIAGAIIMGLLVLVQMLVQYRLISRYPLHRLPNGIARRIVAFVHTPFSMFAAFSWMLFTHCAVLACVDNPKEESLEMVAAGLISVLAIIGWAGLFGAWTRGNRDGVFALSMAWALLTVAVRQSDVVFLMVEAGVLSLSMPVAILIIRLKERSSIAQVLWSSSYAVRE